MPRVRLRITGRVQGVGFRWFARERARELGVAGWARNLADGSVEVVAEADAEPLGRLVEQLRIGPPGANVAAIEELGDPGGDLPPSFTIQR